MCVGRSGKGLCRWPEFVFCRARITAFLAVGGRCLDCFGVGFVLGQRSGLGTSGIGKGMEKIVCWTKGKRAVQVT